MSKHSQLDAALQRLDEYELGKATMQMDHPVSPRISVRTDDVSGIVAITATGVGETAGYIKLRLSAKEAAIVAGIIIDFLAENMDDTDSSAL